MDKPTPRTRLSPYDDLILVAINRDVSKKELEEILIQLLDSNIIILPHINPLLSPTHQIGMIRMKFQGRGFGEGNIWKIKLTNTQRRQFIKQARSGSDIYFY